MSTSAQKTTPAATIPVPLPENNAIEIISEAMLAFAILSTGKKNADIGDLYTFRPADVTELYLRKVGSGEGLWFRLHDGRVFDHHGAVSESAPEWYEHTFH